MDTDEEDLEALIRRALEQGEKADWGVLFERQRRWMEPQARAMLAERPYVVASAEDVVQATWQRALAALATFTAKDPLVPTFCGWLAVIQRNHVVDLGRRLEAAFGRLESDALAEASAGGPTPSRQAAATQAFVALAGCVEGLPEPGRTAVRLHYLEGLSMSEAAGRMGKTRDAVDGMLKRSRVRLQDCLGRSSLYYLPPKKRDTPPQADAGGSNG